MVRIACTSMCVCVCCVLCVLCVCVCCVLCVLCVCACVCAVCVCVLCVCCVLCVQIVSGLAYSGNCCVWPRDVTYRGEGTGRISPYQQGGCGGIPTLPHVTAHGGIPIFPCTWRYPHLPMHMEVSPPSHIGVSPPSNMLL